MTEKTMSIGSAWRSFYDKAGLPRIIIGVFFIFLNILSILLGITFGPLMTDVLIRALMNMILVLAMVPGIRSGIGLNFGLPLGILCGLLGGVISIEMDLSGAVGFFAAILISIPFAIIVGIAYGFLLNRVKGSEMMVATYVGFSAVSLMCIGWMLLPLTAPEMAWPMGRGVRTTISLEGRFNHILNDFWRFPNKEMDFSLGGFEIPTGLILFVGFMLFMMWVINRSKMGIAMKAVGANPKFAVASGLNVNFYRMFGTVLSTVFGAVGILVYAQSFGFLQLYLAPMFMGFAAVAGVLIGGANVRDANVSHVIIGTFLFQGLLVVALPVANNIMTLGSLAEITRIVVSNGIILYALTQVTGGD